MPPRRHTDREFESELQAIRLRLLEMGGLVEAMIEASVRALVRDDVELARATILEDRKVNQSELEADEHCMRVLARWQPMAGDLRFLIFSLKVVTDLERIGDLAVNVCERVIELHGARPEGALHRFEHMGKVARDMLAAAIEAFVDGDADAARAVLARDDEVDELYHEIFRRQIAHIDERADELEARIRLQNVAKYLERVGDHATNLAEQVIFLLRGTDVRHEGKRRR